MVMLRYIDGDPEWVNSFTSFLKPSYSVLFCSYCSCILLVTSSKFRVHVMLRVTLFTSIFTTFNRRIHPCLTIFFMSTKTLQLYYLITWEKVECFEPKVALNQTQGCQTTCGVCHWINSLCLSPSCGFNHRMNT